MIGKKEKTNLLKERGKAQKRRRLSVSKLKKKTALGNCTEKRKFLRSDIVEHSGRVGLNGNGH